jgi:hypothetical protein
VFGANADDSGQRSSDQRQRRLPAIGVDQLFQNFTQSRRRLAAEKADQHFGIFGQTEFQPEPGQRTFNVVQLQSVEEGNETFDVPTYGNSANGTEGPGKIHAFNLNLFTTFSSTRVNEFHATYLREDRPRSAAQSNIPADTAMGFATSFRFGNPFFLGPNVDELFQRWQLKDNFSIISGNHTVKLGGDWTHSNNAQVFRGFFNGRYIFDSVTGFLRYASPASLGAGFGPNIKGCSNGSYVAATQLAHRVRLQPEARCCCTCRALRSTARRRTPPAHQTLITKNTRSSFRTSGKPCKD